MPFRALLYGDLENAFDDPEHVARVAGRIAAARDDDAVVLGAGDSLAPSVTGLTERGDQTLPFYETVRPVAETVGNHDFDLGLDALRNVVRESPQSWVSANLSVDGLAGVRPSERVERGGETALVVGATDPGIALPEHANAMDPVEAVEETVAGSAPADRVVVLAHAGRTVAADLARVDAVDAVLAGHLHDAEARRVDGTPVVRAGANGRALKEVTFDGEVSVRTLRPSEASPDETVRERLRAVRERAGLDEVVTRVDRPVERSRERGFQGRSRALALVADAYRRAGDADVGFVDVRGLRGGPPLSGAVTAADLVGLVPFDAPLEHCRVTGAELRALVSSALVTAGDVLARTDGDAAWMGYVSGLRVRWTPADGVEGLLAGGEPVRADETYSLTTNPYVPGTDAEFDALTFDHVEESGERQYEAVVRYAREHGIPELDDRFERVDGGRGR